MCVNLATKKCGGCCVALRVAQLRGGVAVAGMASASTSIVDVEQGATSANTHVWFRDLRRDDVQALQELQLKLFPVQYNHNFYHRLFSYDHFCIVGVDMSGAIVAVASARVIDTDSMNEPLKQVQGYIMTLGVRESHRRLGLGARALDEICKLLRQRTSCAVIMLHVKGANTAAIAFYESQGFVRDGPEDGLLRNHYDLDGRWWDAYQYARPLTVPLTTRIREKFEFCVLL